MADVTRGEFEDLRDEVDHLRLAISEMNHGMQKFVADHSQHIRDRGDAEKTQSEWVLNWFAQVTAHTEAMCAISATLALLLTEAGLAKDSIVQSIDEGWQALDLDKRKLARPIFDAVISAIRIS